jgi:hypothetical protein
VAETQRSGLTISVVSVGPYSAPSKMAPMKAKTAHTIKRLSGLINEAMSMPPSGFTSILPQRSSRANRFRCRSAAKARKENFLGQYSGKISKD